MVVEYQEVGHYKGATAHLMSGMAISLSASTRITLFTFLPLPLPPKYTPLAPLEKCASLRAPAGVKSPGLAASPLRQRP